MITIFDNDSLERRAQTFYNGLILFKMKGLTQLDYVDFHFQRTSWSRRILITLIVIFFLLGAIFLFHGIWFLGTPLLIIPFILISLFENRQVRKNRFLMLEILTSEQNRHRFFNADKRIISDLFLNPGLAEIENTAESFSLNSDSPFESELLAIMQCENRFNKMTMNEVVEIFSLMCRPEVKRDCPQISKKDLVYFLKIAFLKEKVADGKKKISFISKTNENTRGLFYHFYFQSKQKGYVLRDQTRDDYIRLLTDHFLGFNYEQVSKNFRDKRNGKSFLILSAKH